MCRSLVSRQSSSNIAPNPPNPESGLSRWLPTSLFHRTGGGRRPGAASQTETGLREDAAAAAGQSAAAVAGGVPGADAALLPRPGRRRAAPGLGRARRRLRRARPRHRLLRHRLLVARLLHPRHLPRRRGERPASQVDSREKPPLDLDPSHSLPLLITSAGPAGAVGAEPVQHAPRRRGGGRGGGRRDGVRAGRGGRQGDVPRRAQHGLPRRRASQREQQSMLVLIYIG